MEVQFDEHKLLVVYAADLRPFIEILDGHGIERNDIAPIMERTQPLQIVAVDGMELGAVGRLQHGRPLKEMLREPPGSSGAGAPCNRT